MRIVYCRAPDRGLARLCFRRKMARRAKGCAAFANDTAQLIKCEKIYRDGTALALFHLKEILLPHLQGEIVVFTTDPADIGRFDEILRRVGNVSFLTTPEQVDAFETILMEEYGITGNVGSAVRMIGKTVVIMPSGAAFRAAGAERVISFCAENLPPRCVNAGELLFRLPKALRGAPKPLQSAAALQTAMDFFGLDYALAQPEATKLTK